MPVGGDLGREDDGRQREEAREAAWQAVNGADEVRLGGGTTASAFIRRLAPPSDLAPPSPPPPSSRNAPLKDLHPVY